MSPASMKLESGGEKWPGWRKDGISRARMAESKVLDCSRCTISPWHKDWVEWVEWVEWVASSHLLVDDKTLYHISQRWCRSGGHQCRWQLLMLWLGWPRSFAHDTWYMIHVKSSTDRFALDDRRCSLQAPASNSKWGPIMAPDGGAWLNDCYSRTRRLLYPLSSLIHEVGDGRILRAVRSIRSSTLVRCRIGRELEYLGCSHRGSICMQIASAFAYAVCCMCYAVSTPTFWGKKQHKEREGKQPIGTAGWRLSNQYRQGVSGMYASSAPSAIACLTCL